MANNPTPHSTAPPGSEGIPPVADIPHAPVIFFDGIPTFGHANGVFNVTLAVGRSWINSEGAVVTDNVVAAYLRGSARAFQSLHEAIQKMALLAAQTGQQAAS